MVEGVVRVRGSLGSGGESHSWAAAVCSTEPKLPKSP